jgi:hypothetical protein
VAPVDLRADQVPTTLIVDEVASQLQATVAWDANTGCMSC